ncbi:SDR family NAD(P)-dependent oxidoreductase [Fuerstiella marisgermanici]|uniref:Ketoacyl reductase n=1 Tax=Fuerstiella marisgermanici TaxID=1891926 RepID=A0A1P8WCM2_9PLAN|nr:SDR family oxidoreductase [Fuerstiella marisgermanici]APZ91806.1 Putative ketoacyl reductase [Fuerstiella marisgermanici]
MSTLKKLAIGGSLAFVGLRLARYAIRQSRRFDWQGKRVLITGASRGLGLVIARQLADKGARLAICARSADDLREAKRQLEAQGAEVHTVPCDVRDRSQVTEAVRSIEAELGGIDVLINVAGIIEVGPFDAMTNDDFEDSMATNCWGALNTIKEVLPGMKARGFGRITNIASMGGKRAVPHMLPYAASKFALVGLSNGLRAELLHENIFVTTACPGLMRTGSPRNAKFKGQHRYEYAWFSIGDSLPLVSMDVEQAAAQIIRGCEEGRGEFVVTSPLNIAIHLQSLFPELTRDILALMATVLPKMGGIGQQAARGYDSESAAAPSFLTELSQRSARENNQYGYEPPAA